MILQSLFPQKIQAFELTVEGVTYLAVEKGLLDRFFEPAINGSGYRARKNGHRKASAQPKPEAPPVSGSPAHTGITARAVELIREKPTTTEALLARLTGEGVDTDPKRLRQILYLAKKAGRVLFDEERALWRVPSGGGVK